MGKADAGFAELRVHMGLASLAALATSDEMLF